MPASHLSRQITIQSKAIYSNALILTMANPTRTNVCQTISIILSFKSLELQWLTYRSSTPAAADDREVKFVGFLFLCISLLAASLNYWIHIQLWKSLSWKWLAAEYRKRKFLLLLLLHWLSKLSLLATTTTKPWIRISLALTQSRHLHEFNKWQKPFFHLLPLTTALPHLPSDHHSYCKIPILSSKSNWGPYLRRHWQVQSSFIKSTDSDLFVPRRDYSSIRTVLCDHCTYTLIFQKWLVISSEVIH